MTAIDVMPPPYRPLPGVPDELVGPDGRIRPVWRRFVDHFLSLAPEEVAARFARGEQYLRDAGVFYRLYEQSGSTERDWPLSHIPLLFDGHEWEEVSRALVQRAELLERLMADLYGPNRLVGEGLLPPALVAGNPEWLRPLVGIQPASSHYLHVAAFEIGRGPDGHWWVLGDRTQAPSGLAFALENRVATARIFADLFAEANVHRLAGFFRVFRETLEGLRREAAGPVGVLTPGPWNESYYEHAFIARYLGFMLLEGEDLTVENGEVMVRTVRGLQPIRVLWRRIDSSWVDPLELDEHSRLGTPGMVEALRRGTLAMVNFPGAGILETRAFLAFLPRLCEALLGESLAMPNVATWWCGQPAERRHVAENLERMVIGPALSTRLPFEVDGETVPGSEVARRAPAEVMAWLEAEGAALVGQEAVTLSTTPTAVNGRLVPRPMSLRVFVARSPEGWIVMPGGYARVGRSEDPRAVSMQRGGSVADVWVIAEAPVTVETNVTPVTAPYTRPRPALLPSRAAENLYWLGRYSERSEGKMRLLRAWHARLAEYGDASVPVVARLREYLESIGMRVGAPVPEALRHSLEAAMNCASRIRDRFSIDGWLAIKDLARSVDRLAGRLDPGADAAHAMGVLLRKVSGFSGLIHENMYRATSWRFLALGRSIERASLMASLLASLADPEAPEGSLDIAVEVGDSVMTHRRRFAVITGRNTVIDLLALDALNPRSILYHVSRMRERSMALPVPGGNGAGSPVLTALLELGLMLESHNPESLDTEALQDVRQSLWKVSDLVAATYWP